MISAISWVGRGVSKSTPLKYIEKEGDEEREEEEMKEVEAEEKMDEEEEEDVMSRYNLDDYDEGKRPILFAHQARGHQY
jgi:hypothetical protein